MKSYEDLQAWQTAMDLIEEIYSLTTEFPKAEQYGLSSQLKKAASSIAANIAEGFGRYTYPDKANKFTIARGECTEVDAFLKIAIRVRITSAQRVQKALLLSKSTGKLLSGLIQSCRRLQLP